MYISRRSVAAIYKLGLGAISLILEWSLMALYGVDAFRLFPSWVLLLSAVYFLFSALMIALNDKREFGKNYCPMLEGMIMMNLFLMGGMALASMLGGFYLPELPTWLAGFICAVLPLAVLTDWIVFVKKGRWRAMVPFYWVALPVCYAAMMIFTAEISIDTDLLYPVEALNYLEFGLFEMLGWFLVVILLELIVGYIFFLMDFTASGKLAKKIVLPHIRTVVINEDGTTTTLESDQRKEKSENKKANASEKMSSVNNKKEGNSIKSRPKAKKAPEIETVIVSKNTKVKTKIKKSQNQDRNSSNKQNDKK